MWEIDAAVGMGDLGGRGNMDSDAEVYQTSGAGRWTSWSSRSPGSTPMPT